MVSKIDKLLKFWIILIVLSKELKVFLIEEHVYINSCSVIAKELMFSKLKLRKDSSAIILLFYSDSKCSSESTCSISDPLNFQLSESFKDSFSLSSKIIF